MNDFLASSGFLAPVTTSFPDRNTSIVIGSISGYRTIAPGNCSGS